MENITHTAVDLAKSVFEVRSENHAGRLVSRKTVRRDKFLSVMAQLPKDSTVVMEACSGSNYWAREFEKLGLKPKLIAPQFVVAFRKSQKNDSNDAQAIAEASRRPTMRFVSIKSEEQLDEQMLHRVRDRITTERTALVNQIRALLCEHGIVMPQGISQFEKNTALLLGESLATTFSFLLADLWSAYLETTARLKKYTAKIIATAKENELCKKIMPLAGIGELTASAVISHLGDGRAFKNGRNASAYIGLVPRQFSTGGKPKLGSITKAGDSYVRKLLIHGARSVVRYAVSREKTDPLSLWIRALHKRIGANKTAVALANKTVRRIWAILMGKQPYEKPVLTMAA